MATRNFTRNLRQNFDSAVGSIFPAESARRAVVAIPLIAIWLPFAVIWMAIESSRDSEQRRKFWRDIKGPHWKPTNPSKPPSTVRTQESLRHHYEVEKGLATKLKNAPDRASRSAVYETMYDILFREVPDHPRLTRRMSVADSWNANLDRHAVLRKFIDKSTVLLEYAPGDCKFSQYIAPSVSFVYGVDISDQRAPSHLSPENFKLIVYDGYDLDEIPDASVDVVFSDQLIEHLHPDDTGNHFEVARRLLKPGGKYVFRTPHERTGPHDISQYFSDVPEGFHLKEWGHADIRRLLNDVGYSAVHGYWNRKGRMVRLPYAYFVLTEWFWSLLPKTRITKRLAGLTLSSLCVVAVK